MMRSTVSRSCAASVLCVSSWVAVTSPAFVVSAEPEAAWYYWRHSSMVNLEPERKGSA